MEFYEKMRYLRKKKGVAQEVACKGIGVSISCLRNYESSNIKRLPKTDILEAIAQYYNVPREYLLNDNCINTEYNNIDIGQVLSLSDLSIEKIKEINSYTKNNIVDNFISNISKDDFWSKLDECTRLASEIRKLQPITEIEKYKEIFFKYSNKDDMWAYFIKDAIEYEKYYKKNYCRYNKKDKINMLKCIDILENNDILGEDVDNGNTVLDYSYDYVTTDIKKFINNNASIPIGAIYKMYNIPTIEIEERNKQIEILGFYISNEVVRYIKNL